MEQGVVLLLTGVNLLPSNVHRLSAFQTRRNLLRGASDLCTPDMRDGSDAKVLSPASPEVAS